MIKVVDIDNNVGIEFCYSSSTTLLSTHYKLRSLI